MRSALTVMECEMNGATVDGGTGQFILHNTICTSLCVVSLLQPPPSGGRDAVKSLRVGVIGVLLDYKVQNMSGLKVNSEHLTLSCNLVFFPMPFCFLLHNRVLRGI